MKLAGLLLRILIVVTAAHVALSFALAAWVDWKYDHRIFNVGRLRAAFDFVPFAERLLRQHHAPGKDLVVVVGSSFTFGYDFSDRVVYSRQLASRWPDATVLNLSVVGGEGVGVAAAATCALRLAGLTPDHLIVELPVINDAIMAKRRLEAGTPIDAARRGFVCPASSQSLPWYFLVRPRGVGWIETMRDTATRTAHRAVVLSPLEKDYFVDLETYQKVAPALMAARVSAFRELSEAAPVVTIFAAPLYIDGLVKLGFDRANIARQINDVFAACRAAGGVQCLDPFPLTAEEALFGDVTHLSAGGHKLFADWLAKQTTANVRAARH